MKQKNDFFDSLMNGLKDASDGNIKTSKRSIIVVPVKQFSKEEIKAIRNKTKMSQRLFASYLGVSVKTVEAWESGKNTPSGSTSRLLNMFEMNENLALDYPFVIIE